MPKPPVHDFRLARRHLLQAFAGSMLLPSRALASATRLLADPDPVLVAAATAAGALHTLHASGTQVTISNVNGVQTTNEIIELSLKRPDHLHLSLKDAVTGSETLKLISDGTTLYTVHPLVSQYETQALADVRNGIPSLVQTDAGFYQGLDGNVTTGPTKTVGGVAFVSKIWKQSKPELTVEETFYFGASNLVEGYDVATTGGPSPIQQNTWFSVFETDPTVSDDLFTFTPPAGYVLVTQGSDLPSQPAPPAPAPPLKRDFTLPKLGGGTLTLSSSIQGKKAMILDFVADSATANGELNRLKPFTSQIPGGLGVVLIFLGTIKPSDLGPIPSGITVLVADPAAITPDNDVAVLYGLVKLPSLIALDSSGQTALKATTWTQDQVEQVLHGLGIA